jgi:pimeloyl-ACP methyl ester carboxylesterase
MWQLVDVLCHTAGMLVSLRSAASFARLAALLSVAAALGSCSSPSESEESRETKNRTLSFRGCDEVKCSGELDGAKYQVKLPQTWNGTLLIYSHGYREAEPAPPTYDPVETDARAASTDETAEALLKSGFALVGSSYSKNGWAVEEGVKAGEDLYDWFRHSVGQPDRVYVWGDSLGGLITQTLAEKHPEWVSGVAPMCGVLGGLNLNLDLGLDLQYAIKTLLYPEMKLTGYASHAEAAQTWTEAQKRIMAATKDLKNGVPKLLAIQAMLDGPTKTARFDGSTPKAQVSAMVESALTGLALATYGRYDIEQRVGGNPSTNENVNYAERVTPGERKLADALAPGGIDKALAALKAGPRVKADPEARSRAGELGNPTGRLQDPTITLHTAFDQLVLVQNETVFGARVSAATDRKADLVQLYTQPPATYPAPAPYGAGHCNFTVDERVGLIHLLDNWVKGGVYPAPEAVAKAMKGAKGYSPLFKPGPWPSNAIR